MKSKHPDNYVAFVTQQNDMVMGTKGVSMDTKCIHVMNPVTCREERNKVTDDDGEAHTEVTLYMEAILAMYTHTLHYHRHDIKFEFVPSEFMINSYRKHLENRGLLEQ